MTWKGNLIDAIRREDINETLLILDNINKTYPNLLKGEEDDNKNTILHDIIEYIEKPNLTIFSNILKLIDPNIVNVINLDDYSALHYAIELRHFGICKMLIPKMNLETLVYVGGYDNNSGRVSDLAYRYGMLSIKTLIDKRIKKLEKDQRGV